MMPPPPPPPPPPGPPHDPHILEANGRYQTKPENPAVIVFLNVVNTITQLLIGAVAFSAFTFASIFNFKSPLTQHIYLCVFGYVILLSQSILSFNRYAGWAYSLKYPEKKLIHGAMSIIGSSLAIAGSLIKIIDDGNLNNNFETAHGITGLIAMLLTILSLVGGLLNFFSSCHTKSILYSCLHTCLGALTLSVAFVCLCLGFTDWYRFMLGDLNANTSIALTVFAMIGILISGFYRICSRLVN